MFFGMTNSIDIFQTMMKNIFQDFIVEDIMIVYLDDILIFTWVLEEHYKVICRVLEVLAEHNLFLHSKKCKFDRPCIEYIGLVISGNQVIVDL